MEEISSAAAIDLMISARVFHLRLLFFFLSAAAAAAAQRLPGEGGGGVGQQPAENPAGPRGAGSQRGL